ncbi:uncharacterized protein LOC127863986 [Dreissena polymorpha]|uniref:uncharacterized protein LOC127863986 n=1 Tax=Dreissena polymorpha TaxID=45954 RepID=UPI002265219C|nr:uncharacterized protein LOC127863986 [Dreissena polymorpha]
MLAFSFGKLDAQYNESDTYVNDDNTSSNVTQLISTSLHLTRLVVQTYLVPIVVAFGLVGNLLNILVLVNPKMRSSTNVYLLSLAVCNSLYLLSNVQTNGQSASMDFIRIAGNICNFLVQVNASVNFILYYYFSSKFRRTLKTLVCRCYDSRMKTIHTRSFAESFQGLLSRSTFRLTVTAASSIKPRKSEYNSSLGCTSTCPIQIMAWLDY